MTFLDDPERHWQNEQQLTREDRTDVEARIGPTAEELVPLSGGHANLNIRVGTDRVLRIYRRDPSASRLEATLLRQEWRHLRVPRVLDAGRDFLVLEYVEHRATAPDTKQAVATGRALAEIHRVRFPQAGFFDPGLRVCTPLPDVVGGFKDYVHSEVAQMTDTLPRGLGPKIEGLLISPDISCHAGPPVLLHGDFKASNLHWTDDDELLVLDWEFAYAGPALLDVGQLMRWSPPDAFIKAFAEAYRSHGGVLPSGWRAIADAFDLVNLVGMLSRTPPGSRRAVAIVGRIQRTLAAI